MSLVHLDTAIRVLDYGFEFGEQILYSTSNVQAGVQQQVLVYMGHDEKAL